MGSVLALLQSFDVIRWVHVVFACYLCVSVLYGLMMVHVFEFCRYFLRVSGAAKAYILEI